MKKLICTLAVLALTTGASAQVINEFVANHVSTDTNEYLEIYGAANTDYSSLRILQLEGDSGSAQGNIDSVTTPGTTGANGIWVSAFLNNVIENGTITLLLVSGFTGAVGTDTDTNNDGVIDNVVWGSILDSVAVSDGGVGDLTYSSVVLTSSLAPSGFTPGGASRFPNGVDTDTVGDWLRNDFDGAGIPGFVGNVDPGEILNTPGGINPEPATLGLLAIGSLLFGRRRMS
ncbi:MAG: PEP-CTERM sorting domain-containing protein [Phycisphaerae bacterium]|nr:PEP-CTERM sorting domain-containing protein [Phycisphaerae bacterium]